MCERFIARDQQITDKLAPEVYERYIGALGAFDALVEARELGFGSARLGNEKSFNVKAIRNHFQNMRNALEKQLTERTTSASLADARKKYRRKFGVALAYEFTDGDLARIQTLVNELRDLLSKSELFEGKHKRRVLKKLESLQSEMHKRVSSVDRFWGLIGDAGVVLGKFGNDAKPFVDRVKEIGEIVCRTQARAEELPSAAPFPLLSDGSEADQKQD